MWSDKAWRDAIRVAVLRAAADPKQGRKLNALADRLVDAGLEGDVAALKEIGDRLDGRVPQAFTDKDGGSLADAFIAALESARERVKNARG